MALAQLAITIYLTADVGSRASAGTLGIAILIAIATLELAVMIAFSRIGRNRDPATTIRTTTAPAGGATGRARRRRTRPCPGRSSSASSPTT